MNEQEATLRRIEDAIENWRGHILSPGTRKSQRLETFEAMKRQILFASKDPYQAMVDLFKERPNA
jgi:hypothetical protein